METFDEYWEQYGELHVSMCGGDIKQFAKEIWDSAIGNIEKCDKCGRSFYPQKKAV